MVYMEMGNTFSNWKEVTELVIGEVVTALLE